MTSESNEPKEAARRDAGYVIAFVLSCIAVFWGIFATGLQTISITGKGLNNLEVGEASGLAASTIDGHGQSITAGSIAMVGRNCRRVR